ncbi:MULTISPECIES: helix-turn-helix transcriptional regulator [Streptomyces]|uniref:Helix-turn-helix transcriptional regulator n=1 Tax=Streptomyces koelreuteriae TaxID=2838015 RepID=A0ABX8FQT8_9ACTN|nr:MULTISPECIES: helix-turn-helix transcriptional regulator [Streptomyces]QWB23541.1 helix-turn-helix transcriptional regulator [Streptomyces koelreuteriae]UUA06499.1 helix-turn-helix transcriptional regulator [Streptomyces koelreuteriae]UUA14128.1 helix-turn-helix transcriptional regulator [Streptomyces sp. CRCS-T-1]
MAPPHLLELGRFLMARRAEVSPNQVGLPDAGKRRTPGLRREEVALLAGVGVSWYTWIEQGRAENVSGEVLDSIARVLRLSENQRLYLRQLAGVQAVPLLPDAPPEAEAMRPFVENWWPNPAYIADHAWNVVVANAAAESLLGMVDEHPGDARLGRRRPYNILREFFTNDRARSAYPLWDKIAPTVVARFRSQAALHIEDAAIPALVAELRVASPLFAQLWDRHEVLEDSCGPEVLTHPAVGDLHFTRATLDFTRRIALRMTVFLPAPGTGTEAALRRMSHVTLSQRMNSLNRDDLVGEAR